MKETLFYTVEDVMKIIGIKKSSAYRLINELNTELESKGTKTQRGVVKADYFRERVYI